MEKNNKSKTTEKNNIYNRFYQIYSNKYIYI